MRLCVWHKVNRNLRKNLASALEKLSPRGKAKFQVVEQWLYSITSSVESQAEATVSFGLLNSFLEEAEQTEQDHMSPLIVSIIQEFVNKYKASAVYYAHFHFMRKRCFGKRTTGGSESENSVMKRSHIGPRSNQPLDTSQASISRVSEICTQRKNTI